MIRSLSRSSIVGVLFLWIIGIARSVFARHLQQVTHKQMPFRYEDNACSKSITILPNPHMMTLILDKEKAVKNLRNPTLEKDNSMIHQFSYL